MYGCKLKKRTELRKTGTPPPHGLMENGRNVLFLENYVSKKVPLVPKLGKGDNMIIKQNINDCSLYDWDGHYFECTVKGNIRNNNNI